MAGTYHLRGENEYGDPVILIAETCHRCGALVNVFEVSMEEHHQVAHGAPAPRLAEFDPPEQRRR